MGVPAYIALCSKDFLGQPHPGQLWGLLPPPWVFSALPTTSSSSSSQFYPQMRNSDPCPPHIKVDSPFKLILTLPLGTGHFPFHRWEHHKNEHCFLSEPEHRGTLAGARHLTDLEDGCTVIPLPQFLNPLYLAFVIFLKLYPQQNLGKPRILKDYHQGTHRENTKGSLSVSHFPPLPSFPFCIPRLEMYCAHGT